MDNKQNEELYFKKVVFALGVVFLIFGSIFFFYFVQNQNEDYMDNSANPGRIEQTQTTDLNQQFFAVSINSKIYVDSTGRAVAYIKNDKTNSYNMQVNIKDDITGESLYQSETIKPGNELDSITIKNNLQVGKYDAIAEFFALTRIQKREKER